MNFIPRFLCIKVLLFFKIEQFLWYKIVAYSHVFSSFLGNDVWISEFLKNSWTAFQSLSLWKPLIHSVQNRNMSIKDQVSPLIICLMTIKYKELIGFAEENSKSQFTYVSQFSHFTVWYSRRNFYWSTDSVCGKFVECKIKDSPFYHNWRFSFASNIMYVVCRYFCALFS
jgi:hypothetical protein